MSYTPLVSCLCVTRVRDTLSDAVAAFHRQDYPNKELILVFDDLEKSEQVQQYSDKDVRIFYDGSGVSLGGLRNRSVKEARGDIVIQWDDDDIYASDRVSVQVSALLESDKDVCLLTSELVAIHDSVFLLKDWPFEGTLCAYREAVPAYPDIPKGEDTEIFRGAREEWCRFAAFVNSLHYVRRYHGHNTWDLNHYSKMVSKLSCDFKGSDATKAHRLLEECNLRNLRITHGSILHRTE